MEKEMGGGERKSLSAAPETHTTCPTSPLASLCHHRATMAILVGFTHLISSPDVQFQAIHAHRATKLPTLLKKHGFVSEA